MPPILHLFIRESFPFFPCENWLIARSPLSSSTQCEEREAKSASADEVDSKTKLRRLQSDILKATKNELYHVQQAETARLLRCKLAKKYQTQRAIKTSEKKGSLGINDLPASEGGSPSFRLPPEFPGTTSQGNTDSEHTCN
jgi:hypothetical protein